MAIVANLDVALRATTSKFERGMKRASSTVANFRKQVLALRNPTSFLAASFSPTGAVIAGFAALSLSIRQVAKDISRLQDVSTKLGIDINQLRAFEVAAEQTGVTTQQLEMGLQRMTRRIAEAAMGTGEAKNAIKELGLSAQDLVQLDAGNAFLAVGDALSNVKLESDRVRLAFKLFDSEGVNLVRTLGLGRDELEALQERLDASGKLTPELIEGIKQFEASWIELKAVLATTVVPFIKEVLLPVMQAVNKIIEGTNRLLGTLGTNLGQVIAFLNPITRFVQLLEDIDALRKTLGLDIFETTLDRFFGGKKTELELSVASRDTQAVVSDQEMLLIAKQELENSNASRQSLSRLVGLVARNQTGVANI